MYMPRYNSINFIKISLKLSYFCPKIQNFSAQEAPLSDLRASGGWELRPQIPNGFQWLGAPPPDPRNIPPIAYFWLRGCSKPSLLFDFNILGSNFRRFETCLKVLEKIMITAKCWLQENDFAAAFSNFL